jgi:hypothetical protein
MCHVRYTVTLMGLATLTALGLSAAQPAQAQTNTIMQAALLANDLVYDPLTQQIYASVPSSSGSNGNSITVINPLTALVGTSTFVGSEPGKLALSSDGTSLYTALTGASSVRAFNPVTLTAGLQFSIGSGLQAEDLAVLPGQPQSVAVVRENPAYSPHFVNTTIYDNGVARTNTTAGQDSITFSSTASLLYAYNNSDSDFTFERLGIDSTGFVSGDGNSNLISGYGLKIKYSDGLVFVNNGEVINPQSNQLLGTFSGTGYNVPFAVQSGDTSAYFLTGTGSTLTLKSYNISTFLPTGSLNITGVSGTPGSLIRWGNDGLAFNTSGGQVFLLQTSLVASPEPSPYAAFGLGILGLTGLILRAKKRKADADPTA